MEGQLIVRQLMATGNVNNYDHPTLDDGGSNCPSTPHLADNVFDGIEVAKVVSDITYIEPIAMSQLLIGLHYISYIQPFHLYTI